jgi:antitoxin YefM
MPVEATYTSARDNLALLDRATKDREVVYIRRRGRETVALVAAAELTSLLETAHLLRSPKNAKRLLAALRRALKCTVAPQSVSALRREMRLGEPGSDPRRRPRDAVFQLEFRQDLRYWVETDRRVALRALELVEAILRDPFGGIGKPEPLK